MDFYEVVALRRTVRDFQDRPIPGDVLERIIGAGLQAPTNDHLRQWEFIILGDKDQRLEVIRRVRNGPGLEEALRIVDQWGLTDQRQRDMYIDAIPKQYRMLRDAGCLILPAFRHRGTLLEPESLSALNSFASIWCCIENMLLAAAAEGILGVTRIPFDEEIHPLKAALGVPEGYEIPCYLALGYPAKELPPIRQTPVCAQERMHQGRW